MLRTTIIMKLLPDEQYLYQVSIVNICKAERFQNSILQCKGSCIAVEEICFPLFGAVVFTEPLQFLRCPEDEDKIFTRGP